MGEIARRRLLPKLSAEVRAEVERLLQYPPHSAGGIMTTEFVRLDPAWTVGDCLKHVRTVAREKESIYAGYVMEPDTGRLYVVGFNLIEPVPEYPSPLTPFYYACLAVVPSDSNAAEAASLSDSGGHDLVLPASIVWTRAEE